jgi:hypothetical protein
MDNVALDAHKRCSLGSVQDAGCRIVVFPPRTLTGTAPRPTRPGAGGRGSRPSAYRERRLDRRSAQPLGRAAA